MGRRRTILAGAVALPAILGFAVIAARRGSVKPSVGRSGQREDIGATAAGTATGPRQASVEERYTVRAGDTLSAIAARFGTTVDALIEANRLGDPDAILVGQELLLRVVPAGPGPATRLVPDSEVVFGPAYLGFDSASFVRSQGGYLAQYTELVDGESLDGAQIVARVAREFLVGPRVLLAYIESRSGWVSGTPSDQDQIAYPAGLADPARTGLWLQLNWLADRLNRGYYDWRTRDRAILTLADGTSLGGDPALGAGSFAVQYALALQSNQGDLDEHLAAFDRAYRRLFGEPWPRAYPMTDPAAIRFPPLRLPFAAGDRWWLTGGPHGGWADGSAWAALDLVPDTDQRGCFVATRPALAVADGIVVDARPGMLWLDLDGDGHRETGPGVFYLHVHLADGVADGVRLRAGQAVGYPSCEGGASNATHLHIARAYDGEWLAADSGAPFVLGGWRAIQSAQAYDGQLKHQDGRLRHACECREPGYNDID